MPEYSEDGSRLGKVILLAVVAVITLITLGCSTSCVPTGNVGVLTKFGRVTGETIYEGIHLVSPFKSVQKMSWQTQVESEAANVPSKEQLNMTLTVDLVFHLDPSGAADVLQRTGLEYRESLVKPAMASAIREVTGGHTAHDLYSSARDLIGDEITNEIRQTLNGRHIIVEKALLKNVSPPQTLKDAIEAKQKADQDAQRMQFVIQRESLEADRKRIEARGIHDFQAIVASGIDEKLLVWKGIEATEKLADSQNAKIIIVGNSKNGLPLVLGQ